MPLPRSSGLRYGATWLTERGITPVEILAMHGSGAITSAHLVKLRGP